MVCSVRKMDTLFARHSNGLSINKLIFLNTSLISGSAAGMKSYLLQYVDHEDFFDQMVLNSGAW